MAGQHLLLVAKRLLGGFTTIELDVAKQQRHEGAPTQHGSLGVRILRLVHQLLQQTAGQATGFGVVALALGSLGILVKLLKIAVHALRPIASVVSPVGCLA